jgi:hypothetical protein
MMVSVGPAGAQTLHAILVGDTEDASIGTGVIANLNRMRAFLKQVQTEGNIAVSIVEVKDDNFNCREILKVVRDVRVDADDAVVFYYAGHGFRRTETQTQFPEFDCRRSASVDRADLSGVANYLLKFDGSRPRTAPRLLIAIADTCNVLVDEQQVPKQAGRPRVAARPNREIELRQLFLQYSGTLIMSGSSPGDPSWYLSSGGFFTNQLLLAINAHLESVAAARWETIASDATKQIFIPITTPTVQKPQYAPSNLRVDAAP